MFRKLLDSDDSSEGLSGSQDYDDDESSYESGGESGGKSGDESGDESGDDSRKKDVDKNDRMAKEILKNSKKMKNFDHEDDDDDSSDKPKIIFVFNIKNYSGIEWTIDKIKKCKLKPRSVKSMTAQYVRIYAKYKKSTETMEKTYAIGGLSRHKEDFPAPNDDSELRHLKIICLNRFLNCAINIECHPT